MLPGIAGSTERVGPAKVQAQGLGERMARDQPGAQPLTFVLEFEVLRDVAMHCLKNAAERRSL